MSTSIQLKAIFILSLLACNECVRFHMSATDLESTANVADSKDSCTDIQARVAHLSTYMSSKVHKVATKGVAGIKGGQRIVKLGRQQVALTAAVKKFREQKCDGDMSAATKQLASVKDMIQGLCASGEEVTSQLCTAIAEMEAEKAKPPEEQDPSTAQAKFMKTIMGGKGEVTEKQKKLLLASNLTEDVVGETYDNTDESELAQDETVKEGSTDALLEQSSAVGTLKGQGGMILLKGLKGLAKLTRYCVLAVLGMVWFIAEGALIIFVGPLFTIATAAFSGIICFTYWVLATIMEVLTLGFLKLPGAKLFDPSDSSNGCFRQVWQRGIMKPTAHVLDAVDRNNPWRYMSKDMEELDEGLYHDLLNPEVWD